MKKIFTLQFIFTLSFFIIFFFWCNGRSAAQNHYCVMEQLLLHARSNDPQWEQKIEQQEYLRSQWLKKYQQESKMQNILSIPVAVNVIWNAPAENISDAQILSQIDVLNKDLRRLNTDAANTPSAFLSFAADAQIEFCLASVDPQGNPTNGITRTQTTIVNFDNFFGLDTSLWYTSLDGFDGWPSQDYLNIWVGNLGSWKWIGFWPGGTALMPG